MFQQRARNRAATERDTLARTHPNVHSMIEVHEAPGFNSIQPEGTPLCSRLAASVRHVYGSIQKLARFPGVKTTICLND
jgi:hypothetical protein